MNGKNCDWIFVMFDKLLAKYLFSSSFYFGYEIHVDKTHPMPHITLQLHCSLS